MILTVALLTPVIMCNYAAQYSIWTTLRLVTLSIDAHRKAPGGSCILKNISFLEAFVVSEISSLAFKDRS